MTSFFIALQFLTRLKIVNQTEWTMEDFGKSVIAFPYVGLIIGIFLVFIFKLFSVILPLEQALLVVVIAEFLFTGGLHADGLMDTSDGLFSGREREKKLEIMKDSRVGSFGVVAFVFVTLLKWQLLVAIPTEVTIPVILLFMPLMSRFTLVHSIRAYPYARKTGMGQAFAELAPKHVLTWSAISTFFMSLCSLAIIFFIEAFYAGDVPMIPLIYMGEIIPYILFSSLVITIVLMMISKLINMALNRYIVKSLGGTTGDTYGFVVEISEVLLVLVSIILLKLLI